MRLCPVCNRSAQSSETRCPDDGALLVSLETGGVPAADLTGQVIDGRYRITGVLGRGGMGTVYACEHMVVGKRFAMKVLLPGLERTEGVLARFIREAKAANAIKSPHIVESIDFGQLPAGHFYVVMELLEGQSLAAAMKERRLTRADMLEIFIQVCDTLDLAHQANIIHRDLKPDNIFLVRSPSDPAGAPPRYAKLLDFGVAKILGSTDAALTQSGVILGTPYYMSPEQARGQGLDARADLYSLGVVMYHAFTGRLPFVADSAVGVLTAHAIDPPPRPSQVSQVDPELETMILKCLEKRPEDRYQSMRELAGVLRAILSGAAAISGMNRPLPAHDERALGFAGTVSSGRLEGGLPSGSMHVPVLGMDTHASASMAGPLRPAEVAALRKEGSRSLAIVLGAGAAMLALGGLVALLFISRGAPSASTAGDSTAEGPISVPLPSALADARRDGPSEPTTAPEPATPPADPPTTDTASPETAPPDPASPTTTARPPATAAVRTPPPVPSAKPPAKPTAEPSVTAPPPTTRPTSGVSPEIRNPFGDKR